MERRIADAVARGTELIAALQQRLDRLGLPEAIVIPPFETARFSLEKDSYSGEEALRAAFYPSQYYCIGFLLFHPDGSCFAEYHVMRQHPARPEWFIEAVEAWVRDGSVQTDMRQVSMPK